MLGFVLALLTLPASVTQELNASFPGWRLAPVVSETQRWFVESGRPYDPNQLQADFDGDSTPDWALQILHQGRQKVVVLLARNGAWKSQTLTSDRPDPYTFLLLYKKGSRDFDFEKLKAFRYNTDALGIMYFVQTPVTFFWRNGNFAKMLAPSDEDYETR